VATTSIKTNLGIFLGAAVAGVIYFRQFAGFIRRYAILFAALVGTLVYVAASNAAIMAATQRGIDRLNVGLSILLARDRMPGYGGFEERNLWAANGLDGWSRNPVFGYGVESFRSEFGTTSHSTPIDLLYNSGAIGLLLFYAIFISILARLYSARKGGDHVLYFLLFAALICYLFIGLSGIVHINFFFAAFVAISTSLLRMTNRQLFGQVSS
jgi:O-antigen ligase